uniref:Putative 11beta-hydroxysteroid dehydrogenase type 1 n=1 Tax=Panstrongylus lignarius TaxID=156445 RepID=A0A224XFQ0_9HEMI
MDLFSVIGVSVIIYIFIYTVLLSVVDCDLRLFWAEYFGIDLQKAFKGKIIWVTGASSGIGEFLAVEFAKNGAKVILSARSAVNLERVKQRCLEVGARYDNVLVLPFDVTDLSKHEEMFLRVVDHFGKLDVLVNNAGRSQRAFWEKIELEVDYEMFQLNVFSVISLSRIAVEYFEKMDHGGQLVVTSSVAGLIGVPFSGSYTGSKHALHGYFKSLMTEKLGSNIIVTLLCPGPVFSNLLPQCFTAKSGEMLGQKTNIDDRKMTTRRCAYLCAVAIANRLDEAWIGLFPIIPLTYILVYFPNTAKKFATFIGAKQLMKIRDSRNTMQFKED